MLIIQIFISTPVQVYHHHNYSVLNVEDNNKRNYSALSNLSVLIKIDVNTHTTVTEICPVCNHQYTAFYNDEVFQDIKVFTQPSTERYTNYKQSFISAFVLNPSNKSPPLLNE